MKERALELRQRQTRRITIQLVNKAFQRSTKALMEYAYACKITSARRFGWFMYKIGLMLNVKKQN